MQIVHLQDFSFYFINNQHLLSFLCFLALMFCLCGGGCDMVGVGSGDLSSGFDALRCLFWGVYSCLKFAFHLSLQLKRFLFVKD